MNKSRRRRKMNSDNDSLFSAYPSGPATTGFVPYCDEYDWSSNGIRYILSRLEFYDRAYLDLNDYEASELFEPNKL